MITATGRYLNTRGNNMIQLIENLSRKAEKISQNFKLNIRWLKISTKYFTFQKANQWYFSRHIFEKKNIRASSKIESFFFTMNRREARGSHRNKTFTLHTQTSCQFFVENIFVYVAQKSKSWRSRKIFKQKLKQSASKS